MKIRNIQEYIKQWSDSESLHLLGTDDEPFLSKLNGVETQLDAWIEGSASFANNAQEQLFYEFVQNAFDADADSLMFFMNESYLIILNNGVPFFTDPCSDKERDGQLYNFLAKGKSQKRNDNTKLGNFGQGSKLLYTLIADTGLRNTSELLNVSIKQKKRGPYLISWANDAQLQNFLLDRNQWEYGAFDDWENNMLVAKILMSYYPVAPGIDEDLFSKEELSNAISSFEKLVNPRRNINRLRQGTALIVPLGKGQYERINEPNNVKHVRERLGDFAAIQADKPQNKKHNLQHIYVFDEEVLLRKVNSIFLDDVNIEGNRVGYQIAFNPEFATAGTVNFYKALPIHETRYGLGFIIDSENFEVDDSRQRIQDKEKTAKILQIVFKKLKESIYDIIRNDASRWDYIYQSLLNTNIPDGEDYQYIRNLFNEFLLPILLTHVHTNTGVYMTKENVWHAIPECMASVIPLSQIGVAKNWIKQEDFQKLKSYHKIVIQSVNIKDVLNLADQNRLISWIKELAAEKYKDFFDLISPHIEKIEKRALRTNFGNVYSWADLVSTKNILFAIENSIFSYFDIYPKIEYFPIPLLLSDQYSKISYWTTIFGKIESNIAFYAADSAALNSACGLLREMYKADPNVFGQKVRNFSLLSNVHGERLPFRQLFVTRPQGTILYDEFVVKAPIPSNAMKEWFASEDCLWEWIKVNFERIKTLNDWSDCVDKYLYDIKSAYTQTKVHPLEEKKLDLYLDYNGEIISPYKALSNQGKLNNHEYELFTDLFSSISFVPTRFRNKLDEPYFSLSTNKISVEDCLTDDTMVSLVIVPILFKLKSSLLKGKFIKKNNDKYSFISFNGRNYLDVGIDNDIRKVYNGLNYHAIPEEIVTYVPDDYKEECAPNNKDLLLDAIKDSPNRAYLLPLVDKADSVVKESYFKYIKLNISKKLVEKDIEWRVIKYAITHPEWQDSVFEAILFNGDSLPDSIHGTTVECNGTQYDIYELIEDIKVSNEAIENFLALLPEPELFRQTFYVGDRVEQMDYDDVYRNIPPDTELTVKQLEYCFDYAIASNRTDLTLGLADESNLPAALTMIYERKFRNFNRLFAISGYDSTCQVFADKLILLKEEYLPNVLHNWLTEHQDAYMLMDDLMTVDTPLISVRKAVLSNQDIFITDIEESDVLDRTIQWLTSIDVQYDSQAYHTVIKLLNALPNTLSNIPLLRFTSVATITEGEEKKIVPILKLSSLFENRYYLNDAFEASRKFFIQHFVDSNEFYKWVTKHNICIFPHSEFLTDHKLNKKLRIEANQIAIESADCKEWSGILYEKWKESNPNYRILLSQTPIVISFTLTCCGEILYQEQIGNKEFGFKRTNDKGDNYVMVREASTTKQVMDNLKICKDEPSLDWFRPAYIELSDLLLNMIQEKQDVDAILSPTYSGGGGSTGGSARGNRGGNLQVPDNMLAAVRNMINNLTADELNAIDERWEDIRKALQTMDEEEPTSMVRATIGYIGEQIYDRYLTKRCIPHEYVAEHEGEYDFKVEQGEETVYVDVKTNLYSLEDGTAPFYIHKSQSAFMQTHPEAKFRIVRVSLKDINIEREYARIKKIYGAEAAPATDTKLQKECQKIADKYWRGASIDVFDAKSPEYGLSITKLKS